MSVFKENHQLLFPKSDSTQYLSIKLMFYDSPFYLKKKKSFE